MRVLVLGTTGLLGSALFHVLSEKKDWLVFGTLRTEESKRFFAPVLNLNLVVGVDGLRPHRSIEIALRRVDVGAQPSQRHDGGGVPIARGRPDRRPPLHGSTACSRGSADVQP